MKIKNPKFIVIQKILLITLINHEILYYFTCTLWEKILQNLFFSTLQRIRNRILFKRKFTGLKNKRFKVIPVSNLYLLCNEVTSPFCASVFSSVKCWFELNEQHLRLNWHFQFYYLLPVRHYQLLLAPFTMEPTHNLWTILNITL